MSVAIDTETSTDVDKEAFDEECVVRREAGDGVDTGLCLISVVCNSTCDSTA